MRLIDADALDLDREVELADDWKTAHEIANCVKYAPTVDAVPVKHGWWIPVLNGIDDDANPAFECSECDAMCRKKHNYCPVCGEKMDLEEQDAN